MTTFDAEYEQTYQAALGHHIIVDITRCVLFNLTGQFPGGPSYPGNPSPVAVPAPGGPGLLDKVYTPVEYFARVMAGSMWNQHLPVWDDFEDGWRKRFADSTCDIADSWGFEEQVQETLRALRATGLMREIMKSNDALVVHELYRFAVHFLQSLRMTAQDLDPDLLTMHPDEQRDVLYAIYGGGN